MINQIIPNTAEDVQSEEIDYLRRGELNGSNEDYSNCSIGGLLRNLDRES